MFKKFIFVTIIISLLTLIFLFAYFIYVNILLKEKVLPSVNVFGNNVSVSSSENLEEITYSNLINLLPSELVVDFAGTEFNVPKSALAIKIDSEKLLSYGKGSDILKVWKQGLGLATGDKQIDITELMQVDISGIYNYLDYNVLSVYQPDVIEISANGYLTNCDDSKFYGSLVSSINKNQLLQNLIEGKKFIVPITGYEQNLVKACRKYNSEKSQIVEQTSGIETSFDATFGVYIDSNGDAAWSIIDYSSMYDFLNTLSISKNIDALDGFYEIHNNKIYLFESYIIGQSLDIQSTLDQIPLWLNNLTQEFPLQFNEIRPKVLTLNLEIFDFTKLYASGKSRIDITRDGVYNWGLDNAQVGIEEMENTIVYPGEEFSYIKHINPQPNGLSVNGRAIGAGICNATTTLFRATLESGFPITDRSYHAHNYDSYEWGYPLNIVDAAYLTTPVVDFKFVNDLKYPILIKMEITRPGDNWQYHTLKIYTSSNAPDRKVELYDWKKWNEYSSKNFEASFKRKVFENGAEIRSDEFYSRYW